MKIPSEFLCLYFSFNVVANLLDYESKELYRVRTAIYFCKNYFAKNYLPKRIYCLISIGNGVVNRYFEQ